MPSNTLANINIGDKIKEYYSAAAILLLSILYLTKVQVKMPVLFKNLLFGLLVTLYLIAIIASQYITITIVIIFILVVHLIDPSKLDEMFSNLNNKNEQKNKIN